MEVAPQFAKHETHPHNPNPAVRLHGICLWVRRQGGGRSWWWHDHRPLRQEGVQDSFHKTFFAYSCPSSSVKLKIFSIPFVVWVDTVQSMISVACNWAMTAGSSVDASYTSVPSALTLPISCGFGWFQIEDIVHIAVGPPSEGSAEEILLPRRHWTPPAKQGSLRLFSLSNYLLLFPFLYSFQG